MLPDLAVEPYSGPAAKQKSLIGRPVRLCSTSAAIEGDDDMAEAAS